MEPGSLIQLRIPLTRKDYEWGKELGVPTPQRRVIYTISRGPFLMYCHINKRSGLSIQIEELGNACYDATFFIEVQPPMKITFDELVT